MISIKLYIFTPVLVTLNHFQRNVSLEGFLSPHFECESCILVRLLFSFENVLFHDIGSLVQNYKCFVCHFCVHLIKTLFLVNSFFCNQSVAKFLKSVFVRYVYIQCIHEQKSFGWGGSSEHKKCGSFRNCFQTTTTSKLYDQIDLDLHVQVKFKTPDVMKEVPSCWYYSVCIKFCHSLWECLLGGVSVPSINRMPGGVIVGDSGLCCSCDGKCPSTINFLCWFVTVCSDREKFPQKIPSQ